MRSRCMTNLASGARHPRLLLAEPNPLFYERAGWGPGTRRDRLKATRGARCLSLSRARSPRAEHPIVIASARALMTRTLSRRDFSEQASPSLAACHCPRKGCDAGLVALGFERANTVLEPGQFSGRGGITDIWPPAQDHPIRLDFFGDEVDGIRQFDPGSQRTVDALDWVLVTPAREYILPVTDDEERRPGRGERRGRGCRGGGPLRVRNLSAPP